MSTGSNAVPHLRAVDDGAAPGPWDALPDPVVLTQPNGSVITSNRALAELLGWSTFELVSEPVDLLVAEVHRPVMATPAGWQRITARHRAGHDVPVDLWVAEQGAEVVVMLRDRRDAGASANARHREQAERLEGLAELAGSLAHELNNVLAVVLSSVGFVADAVTDRPAVAADVERIRDAAERAARLTRHLLGSSDAEARHEVVDVGALLADVTRIVEWGARSEVRVRVAPGLPAVVGDARELQELLLSLVLDPEASGPGHVSLAAVAVELDEDEAQALKVESRHHVELSIGCRAPVFAVTAAFRLARRHGGALTVEDDEVRLLLPAHDLPGRSGRGRTDRPPIVLVVDDTEALRQLTARALQKHGYAVLEAASGAEAVRLLEDNHVDLVLTDVVMPGMSGLELHDAVTAAPDAPAVVFMSGYSDAVLPEGGAAGPVLRKPFSEHELLDHVRRGVTPERRAGS